MPQIKSAEKRVRVTEKKTQLNRLHRSKYKTAVKQFEEALEAGEREDIEGAFRNAVKYIDRAAGKNIIHKNKAARLKSQLNRRMLDALDEDSA